MRQFFPVEELPGTSGSTRITMRERMPTRARRSIGRRDGVTALARTA